MSIFFLYTGKYARMYIFLKTSQLILLIIGTLTTFGVKKKNDQNTSGIRKKLSLPLGVIESKIRSSKIRTEFI